MAMYTGKSYFCDFMSLLIITKEDALGNLPMVKVGQEWIEIQCQLRLLCSVFPNYVYYLFFYFHLYIRERFIHSTLRTFI